MFSLLSLPPPFLPPTLGPFLPLLVFYKLITIYAVLNNMNYYEVIVMTVLIMAACLNHTAPLFSCDVGIKRFTCHWLLQVGGSAE